MQQTWFWLSSRLLTRPIAKSLLFRTCVRSSTSSSRLFTTRSINMADETTVTGALSLKNCCNESKSPYVRSHASNPTAWQLWSPETLALARQSNRLLFVSIGYSACHWCHVMAHESFDNRRIASILNSNFIPIKIDREERPDVDRVYMDFLQATSGGGGWPLNVFVTPDLEPIYGGTYWPGPDSERAGKGQPGFEQVLMKVSEAWKSQEAKCRDNAAAITAQLKQFAQEGTISSRRSGDSHDEGELPELELLEDAFEHYKGRFDAQFGGFGGAPKFPTPTHLAFLLRLGEWQHTAADVVGTAEVKQAQQMALKTLENMAKGGMKDQVGNGFARYSVTRDWSLPHFEKMLYDNAQLLSVYLDAYLITKSPFFLEITNDIATYLTSPPILSSKGALFSSEDADSASSFTDSEHKEGAFYVWSAEEFKAAIGDDKAAQVCAQYWNVQPNGNVSPRFDAQGELTGKNTLCVSKTVSELAKESGISEEEVHKIIAASRTKLNEYRKKIRPPPGLDDKIVVSWNGLAIGSLARTAAALEQTDSAASQRYLSVAKSAASFIRSNLYNTSTHELLRVYREGPGSVPGLVDDYAFLISGLLDLYEATFDSSHLEWATELQETQLRLFYDGSATPSTSSSNLAPSTPQRPPLHSQGAFFSTAANAPDILIRSKDALDNAEPSTNGVSASNLFRLSGYLDDQRYAGLANATVRAFDVEITQHPGLFTGLMSAVVRGRLGGRGILISGHGEEVDKAIQQVRQIARPGSTVIRVGDGVDDAFIRKKNSLVRDLDVKKPLIQLCEGTTCRIIDSAGIVAALKGGLNE